MKANRVARSAIIAFAIGALVVAFAEERNAVQQMTPKAVQLRIEGEFPSLGGATEWLNSPPLTAAGLRGKVVLVDFWTYTCMNWRRTVPYVRAWADKYKSQGLVVIGVHSPEFGFEKNIHNIRWAAVRFRMLIDGQPPGVAHGADVDGQGTGAVSESRMYQLIRQPKPIADRDFEIEFLDPGVAAFDFTFG